MRLSLASIVSVFSFVFSFIAPATAGERLQFDVVQPNVEEVISLYLQGPNARLVTSANPGGAVLFNSNSRQLHILDHPRKTVTVVDQSTMEQLASVAQGVGELARSQGGVLGDLFKTFGFDNAMGEKAAIEVKTVANQKQFSGQACQMQQVFKDGVMVTQLCLAKQLKMGAIERDTLKQLLNFAQLLAQKGQLIMQQFNVAVPILPTEMIDGVPVYIDSTESKITATLSGLNSADIPAAQFKVPSGYSETVLGF